jgi:hypothetical protein
MAQLSVRRSNPRRGTGYWPTYAPSAGGFYGSPGEARRAASSVPTGVSGWWDTLPPWQKALLILGGGAVAGELAGPLLASGTGHAAALPAGAGAAGTGTPVIAGEAMWGPYAGYGAATGGAGKGIGAGEVLGWLGKNVRVGSSARDEPYQMPERGHAELLPPGQPTLAGWAPRQGSAGIQPELVLQLLARERGIPDYQWGTPWHRGGAALIGTHGPELVNLPRGASVSPYDDIAEPEYYPPEPVQAHGGWERVAAGLGEEPFSASVNLREPGAGIGLLLAALAGYANYRSGRAARGLKARQTAAEETASVRTRASQKRYESQLAAAEAGAKIRSARYATAPPGSERFGVPSGVPVEPETGLSLGKALAPGKKEWAQMNPAERRDEAARIFAEARSQAAGAAAGKPDKTKEPSIADVASAAKSIVSGQSQLTDYPSELRLPVIQYIEFTGKTIVPEKARNTIQTLASARSSTNRLAELSRKIPRGDAGLGRFVVGGVVQVGAALQGLPEAALFNDWKDGILATLARSVGERGTLTDQDVARARRLLPTFYDTPEVAEGKITQFMDFMEDVERRTIDTYSKPIGGGSPSDSVRTDRRPPLDSFWRP